VSEDLVLLVVPAGGESAPISHGDQAYPCWPETPGSATTRWLCRVPRNVAAHLCNRGGFYRLEG